MSPPTGSGDPLRLLTIEQAAAVLGVDKAEVSLLVSPPSLRGQLLGCVAIALILLGSFWRPASAEPPWPDTDTVKAVIVDRAIAHGVNPDTMLCVSWRESGFSPSVRGPSGERGVSQWLGGRGNAWDSTSAYRELHIDIAVEYERGNPDAVWFDIDGQAELFAMGERVRLKHWPITYGRLCR